MGIKNLTKLIADHAPGCIKDNLLKNYFGRKVAIDASMSLYQFLIAIRQDGNVLMNEEGDVTSHLNGMFYRTIRLVENGIKPIWVFDGKPPEMKSHELSKRKEKRETADKELEVAKESGDAEAVEKFEKRLVKVTREHVEESKELLRLMGMPVVEAAGEAEAQCVVLVKAGKAFAVATEDMDALTFGTPVLLRNLTAPEAKKLPVREYYFSRLLEELGMTHDQFIDMCILLGCDYCDSIRGVGPKRAFELIKEHESIEKIIEALRSGSGKFEIPENWAYKEARRLFQHAEATEADKIDLKWNDPQEEGIVDFLCKKKGFNEERVRKAVEKLRKTRAIKTQARLDDFFKPVAKPPGSSPTKTGAASVKKEDQKAGASGSSKPAGTAKATAAKRKVAAKGPTSAKKAKAK